MRGEGRALDADELVRDEAIFGGEVSIDAAPAVGAGTDLDEVRLVLSGELTLELMPGGRRVGRLEHAFHLAAEEAVLSSAFG